MSPSDTKNSKVWEKGAERGREEVDSVSPDSTDLFEDKNRLNSSQSAELASAALRDFARGRPSSKRSSTASSISRASFHSTQNVSIDEEAVSTSRPVSRHRASNPFHIVSDPTTSCSSSSGSSGGPSSDAISQPIQTELAAQSNGVPNLPRHGPLSSPHPTSRGRPRLVPQGPYESQPHTPMTLGDLGRDYSRYPFPSDSSPFSLPSTPASRYSPGTTPLLSPRAKDHPEKITQLGFSIDPDKKSVLYLDDRLGATLFASEAGNAFPLYLDEKEEDDDLHNPQSGDESTPRPELRDMLSARQLSSLFGLLILILGLLSVFILLPVLSYTGHAIYSYPYDHHDSIDFYPPEPWSHVNDIKYPLFKNIRTGLIDPRTPASAQTKKSVDGKDLRLMFSDEFSTPNRTFYPGDDPYWTAPDIWYGATQDMEWYDPDAATTFDGTLRLQLDSFINHDLLYRSGMINSWNQLCMKGGAIEVSVSLPGPGGASGLWPGIWTMGNLGRPGYKASTEGLWPYTYNSCDAGITANQSMNDGTSYLVGQKLPSCTCSDEDHPTPGTGRGAPEIDVFEASADPTLNLGLITQSYQVAPYDIWYHPNYDFLAIPDINTTQMNGYCGGPFQQAISAQTELNNDWYDAKAFQTYGFEYTPGSLADGKITWFVADRVTFMMTGDAVGPNGNVEARPISEEPMAIVLNVGFSTAWTGIKMEELKFPTTMYVDYVRVYQPPGEESITCDPPGYETTDYIKNHPAAYHNNNLTLWSQTGYPWPQNKMNSDCAA